MTLSRTPDDGDSRTPDYMARTLQDAYDSAKADRDRLREALSRIANYRCGEGGTWQLQNMAKEALANVSEALDA